MKEGSYFDVNNSSKGIILSMLTVNKTIYFM